MTLLTISSNTSISSSSNVMRAPARVIVPALPGVHNTKWVRAIEFGLFA